MSDFGKIMEEWEAQQKKSRKGSPRPKAPSQPNPMEIWLNQYGVMDKDHREVEGEGGALSRRELLALPPQARLDLHGRLAEEALVEAERFLKESLAKGYLKVLIIHGKGHHSPGGKSILKKEIRNLLEKHPRVGEFGPAQRNHGGEGATWAILKVGKKN
jgi:DNA-nicking Smr family endonuclease